MMKIYWKYILCVTIFIGSVLKILFPESIVDIVLFFGWGSKDILNILLYIFTIIEIIACISIIINRFANYGIKVILIFSFIYLLIGVTGYVYNFEQICGEFSRFTFGRFDLPMVFRNMLLFVISIIVYYSLSSNKANYKQTI